MKVWVSFQKNLHNKLKIMIMFITFQVKQKQIVANTFYYCPCPGHVRQLLPIKYLLCATQMSHFDGVEVKYSQSSVCGWFRVLALLLHVYQETRAARNPSWHSSCKLGNFQIFLYFFQNNSVLRKHMNTPSLYKNMPVVQWFSLTSC